jgi:hypothetical protein
MEHGAYLNPLEHAVVRGGRMTIDGFCPGRRCYQHGGYRDQQSPRVKRSNTRSRPAHTSSAVRVRCNCIAEKNPNSAVQVAGGGRNRGALEGTGAVSVSCGRPRAWTRMVHLSMERT